MASNENNQKAGVIFEAEMAQKPAERIVNEEESKTDVLLPAQKRKSKGPQKKF